MSTSVLPRGRQSKLRLAWETTYATAPVSGFQELNAYAHDLARARALEPDDVLGAGFANNVDARPAAPNVEDASAKISVPCDMLQVGYWLAAALGRIAPTGAGPYVHSFASGGTSIPSITLERELLAAAQYDGLTGGVVKTLKMPLKPGKGYNMFDIDLAASQVLAPYASTAAGSPTVATLANRVPNFLGLIKANGTTLGGLIDGALTLTNDITLDRYVNGAEYVAAAILEGQDVAVDVTARYSTDALRAYGVPDGTHLPPVQSIVFSWTLGAMTLLVTCAAVRFEPVNAPVTNGKTITQQLKGRAEVGASTPMLTATLTNTMATEY